MNKQLVDCEKMHCKNNIETTYLDLVHSHSYYNELFMLDSDKNCIHACDLYNGNKIDILLAGYQATALIDSGASISVIDSNFLNTKQNSTISEQNNFNTDKSCMLADGTTVVLKRTVMLPLKLKQVTINANLYVLPMKHVTIIIGCDLLSLLNAKIDFQAKQLIIQEPSSQSPISCLHTSTLGQLELCESYTMSNDAVKYSDDIMQLNTKLKKISLTDSDANSDQKIKLIQLLNSYEDIFANTLSEIGRTDIMEYDIEVPFDTKPIHLPQYKYAYKH